MGVKGVPYKLLLFPIVALLLIMTFFMGGSSHQEFESVRTKHNKDLNTLKAMKEQIIKKETESGPPLCYYLSGSGVGDSTTQGWYAMQPKKMNGKNIYLRSGGAWTVGERYLYYREDGRWAVAESIQVTAYYYTSEPVEYPDTEGHRSGATWAAREADGTYVPLQHYRVIEKSRTFCTPVPELDNVIPEGTDVHPVKGVDYEADFDIFNPKPSPEIKIPDKPQFRFVEEASPALKIPYKIISYMPRIYYFEKLLTDAECDAIVEHAHNQITRSGVVPHKGSKDGTISDVRTSSHAWLNEEVPEVLSIMDRILSITGFKRGDQEALQVLRYEHNQKYDAHHDYFDPSFYGKQSTNRAMTAFLYLDTVEEGGETWFPRANGGPYPSNYHACDAGLRLKPVKGSAVFFYDMRPDLSLDEFSLHGGCPVKKGTKWGGTLWLHTKVN